MIVALTHQDISTGDSFCGMSSQENPQSSKVTYSGKVQAALALSCCNIKMLYLGPAVKPSTYSTLMAISIARLERGVLSNTFHKNKGIYYSKNQNMP